jgi:hypothetical protein
METFDKDKTENTATPRGSGGGLQSKRLPKSDAGDADAPQQHEDEQRPEASDQRTTTADS